MTGSLPGGETRFFQVGSRLLEQLGRFPDAERSSIELVRAARAWWDAFDPQERVGLVRRHVERVVVRKARRRGTFDTERIVALVIRD